ncbi:phosphodiester glycosidase family protein [Aeoliella mucimassa]|uniref:Phosphodiester glycosidase domain-containing protein n=1 Tax=Aeoliella mucimassa TaxID=2527972 RepID=A0A518AWM8_9BACT|nr:phosphodiester glycosidase family protein [Aeoliella mucimassa]QDU59142.1 hypothetical protein Pan181_53830 [Aeoliella mucimassa]
MRPWFVALLCAAFAASVVEAEVPERLAPITRQAEPYQGVTYYRLIGGRNKTTPAVLPRPLVIHLLEIDPQAEGLTFFGTPDNGDAPAEYTRQVTSEFLKQHRLSLAVNGDFFSMEMGTNTDAQGLGASNGKIGSHPAAEGKVCASLVITKDNKVSIVTTADIPEGTWNAVSGGPILVTDGENVARKPENDKLHPRTAAGINTETGHLFLLVADGRQPGFSEGMYLSEMADLFLEFGVNQAINLDGGGSTTLVFADGNEGAPRVINSPSSGATRWTAGWERPVANHLGVTAAVNEDYKRLPTPREQEKAQEALSQSK